MCFIDLQILYQKSKFFAGIRFTRPFIICYTTHNRDGALAGDYAAQQGLHLLLAGVAVGD